MDTADKKIQGILQTLIGQGAAPATLANLLCAAACCPSTAEALAGRLRSPSRTHDPAGVLRELSPSERDMYVYRARGLGDATRITTRRYECTLDELRVAARGDL